MGNCEFGKCDFCGEEKTLARKYICCKNKHFNDNIKGTYFKIIFYCADCGIEDEVEEFKKKLIEEIKKSYFIPSNKEELNIIKKLNPLFETYKNKILDLINNIGK